MSGSAAERERRKRILQGAAAGLGLAAYAALVEPRRVQITEHTVRLVGLPESLAGVRIVQMSDLHLSFCFRPADVRRSVARVNACRPDLVVLTGDFVSFRSMRFLHAGVRELLGLRAPLGVLACLGNHDHWEGPEEVLARLQENGVSVLLNESACLAGGLWLASVDDLMCGNPDLVRALVGVPDPVEPVLLSHNPIVLPQVAERRCLVLSGHTHGGQIALPFAGPRQTPCLPGMRSFIRCYESLGLRVRGGRLDAVSTHRYPAGWYAEGRSRLYVNRGIGVGQDFPFRLNCPPEIACFTLQPADRNALPLVAGARRA